MERRERDPDTGDIHIIYGEGMFDVVKDVGKK